MEGTHVLHGKLGVELLRDVLEEGRRRGGEDDVVDVEQEVARVVAPPEDEQRVVRAGGDEADGADVRCEALEPGTRRLLEAVQRLVEVADVLRAGGVDEAGGLATVDVFLQHNR